MLLPCTAGVGQVGLRLDSHGGARQDGGSGRVRVGSVGRGRSGQGRRVGQPWAVRGLHYAQHVSFSRTVAAYNSRAAVITWGMRGAGCYCEGTSEVCSPRGPYIRWLNLYSLQIKFTLNNTTASGKHCKLNSTQGRDMISALLACKRPPLGFYTSTPHAFQPRCLGDVSCAP